MDRNNSIASSISTGLLLCVCISAAVCAGTQTTMTYYTTDMISAIKDDATIDEKDKQLFIDNKGWLWYSWVFGMLTAVGSWVGCVVATIYLIFSIAIGHGTA